MRFYLVDGSGFIFRAYHACAKLSRPSDGLETGAVHGFCQMLWKLLREAQDNAPTHFAVVFDAKGKKTFRHTICSTYKANRSAAPEALVPQFDLIRRAVRAFGVPAVELPGYEADDVIATLVRQAVKAGGEVVIVTGDKDLMQLIGPGVTILDKDRVLAEPDVIEKFGVPPAQVIDVQALWGDSIDNVPGVPGIGGKTAAHLVRQHGGLDAILTLAAQGAVPGAVWSRLKAYADQARLSRELVTLDRYAPLRCSLDDLEVRDAEYDDLMGFLVEMEFVDLTRRIERKFERTGALL